MRWLIGIRHSLLLLLCLLAAACVDPAAITLRSTVDVLVVDGAITDAPEPQLIRLSRSKADLITGRPGSLPVTKAQVEVIVDSAVVVQAHETEDGTYQLPSDFRGQTGHSYQLRFVLSDGSTYLSTQQVMPTVPSIQRVTARFNPTSLTTEQLGGFTAAHDLYVDVQDPASQTNYYRWGWELWESQDWCRSCVQGRYSVNNVLIKYSANGFQYYQTGDSLFENCFYPPPPVRGGPQLNAFVYDYPCRTQCWAILYGYDLNVFSDIYSNGGLITNRRVAQIPFYQHSPCLVEIRQTALTSAAYQFYNQLAQQTQRTGEVADSSPSILAGNVHNVANPAETVVGVFTASSLATARYWLDRKDTQGIPPGLFEALNGRSPNPEPIQPNLVQYFQILWTHAQPPFTAVCAPTNSSTPYKPAGWRN